MGWEGVTYMYNIYVSICIVATVRVGRELGEGMKVEIGVEVD